MGRVRSCILRIDPLPAALISGSKRTLNLKFASEFAILISMSEKPVNAENPVQVLKLLKKKERTSGRELGADKAIMDFLEAEGFVKKDGTYQTGKRGKPPVAYVAAFDYDYNDAPVYKAPVKRERKEISQETIDKVIQDVQNSTYATNCSCIVEMGPGTTYEQIRALGGGLPECSGGGNYVCPALDAVRRRGNLYAPEQPFQEVV